MSNELKLWKPTSISKISGGTDIAVVQQYNQSLKKNEVNKIIKAFENEDYDMGIEYAWRRAMRAIKRKFDNFDDSLLMELLDRNPDDTKDTISDLEYIRLATDLGILNKTAQLKLSMIHDVINHYLYGELEEDEELEQHDAVAYIINMTKYVFSKPLDESAFDYEVFRNNLTSRRLEVEEIEVVKQSDYFYKRVTIRTLFNLVEHIESGNIQTVYANMNLIFETMWSTLADEDKFKIGKRYSEAVLNNEHEMSSVLRRTLTSVSGFDYVPESLRSNTYIRYANELISTHKAFDNFYLEPDKARQLSQLGTSIPLPALAKCTTAILSSKIGNRYGYSKGAQKYVNELLSSYNVSRWEYYFNKALPFDEDILYKFTNEITFERWSDFISRKINIEDINFTDATVKKLVKYSIENKFERAQKSAKDLLKLIRS